MKQKSIFIATAVILAILFAVGIQIYRGQQAERAASAQNQDALLRFGSPTIGNADAPVHIVEFLDPACETCSAFYPFVKELMAAHPEKIRLTVRYAPFHQGSDQVVKALEAARKQGKYWQALEALLSSQSGWTQHHTARVDLIWPYLEGVGIDIARLKNDMNAPGIAQLIEQDLADAKTLNVTKTPEYFVNGKPLPSFGYEQLQQLVEEALAKAGKTK
jgi:protein-disulfide isomerase